jgi:hypothetical protein
MPKTLKDETILEAVERIARSEAAIYADVEPMSFGDGCRSAYLNIVAQITSRRKDDALLHSSEGPQETKDHSAALLPADPSAPVSTEPLPALLKQVRLWWAESNANEQRYTLRRGVDPSRVMFMRGEQSMACQIGMRIEDLIVSGNQSLSEASGPNAQERERKNTHAQTAAEGRETPDLHEAKDEQP